MAARIMRNKQAGASLMEVLVAMSISLVVTASMIALMANSLGSTTRIIKMTKLSDDLRVAMQMMSRDVRRSNYNVDSMLCYANDDCTSDASLTAVGDVFISDSDDCFYFLTDRGHDDYAATPQAAGGFRRVEVNIDKNDDGVAETAVGVVEMWTGTSDPSGICSLASGATGWVEITNPENMDITSFVVVDDEPGLSYTVLVQDDGFGNTLSQRVRKLRMNLQGALVMDDSITRQVEDIITVRNDLLL